MSELIQLETLPVETLAEMANEAAAACEASGRKTVEHAATCGRALLAIRPQIPHGEWESWVELNFSHGIRRAQQFMDVAKAHRGALLEDATSLRHALRLIADSPEKQAKKQEREAKKQEQQPQKAEAPLKPLAPPTPAPPAKPEWLADPDEMGMPDVDAMPPLPRTNTHHTSANRRTPDARETDRAGIVCPDDPRGLQDGKLYVWSESANRLFLATADEIWAAARELRLDEIRGQMVVEHAVTTSRVVEPKKESVSNKRFTPPTAHEVSAYSDEISAGVDGQQFVDFYESKGWMIGKNKMKDWKAAVRTWKRSENHRGSKITTAVRSNRNWDEEIPEWKPTE